MRDHPDLSIPSVMERLRTRTRQAREESGRSQAQVAELLEWPISKISKIESGRQELLLAEVLQLEDVLDIDLMSVVVRRLKLPPKTAEEVDPMSFHPGYLLQERISPRVPEKPLFPLETKFFPVAKVVRVIDGAQVPAGCLLDQSTPDDEVLSASAGFFRKVRKRFGIQASRLDGLVALAAVRSTDIEMLRRPIPAAKGPVAPRLATRLRGKYMATTAPRLILDPTSLRVTIATEPLLVIYPLRLMFVTVPNYADPECGDTGEEEQAQHVFRLAGLLASTWAQTWMGSAGKLWFTGRSGPFRDVPVPGKLWDLKDAAGLELEWLARAVWESGDIKKMKKIDRLVEKLMKDLSLCP